MKRHFRKPKHMKEHIKKDSNRYLSKNPEKYELKPNLSCKLLREWSSRSIRSRINMSKFTIANVIRLTHNQMIK